jgi:hypothetical protein
MINWALDKIWLLYIIHLYYYKFITSMNNITVSTEHFNKVILTNYRAEIWKESIVLKTHNLSRTGPCLAILSINMHMIPICSPSQNLIHDLQTKIHSTFRTFDVNMNFYDEWSLVLQSFLNIIRIKHFLYVVYQTCPG